MKLNCKPGDLAVVVRTFEGKQVGRICEVLHFMATLPEYGPIWKVRFTSPVDTLHCDGVLEACSPDSWLRPIRDPGEDARDETLEWKPVPTTREKEPA